MEVVNQIGAQEGKQDVAAAEHHRASLREGEKYRQQSDRRRCSRSGEERAPEEHLRSRALSLGETHRHHRGARGKQDSERVGAEQSGCGGHQANQSEKPRF
jgi:hypothetical protein